MTLDAALTQAAAAIRTADALLNNRRGRHGREIGNDRRDPQLRAIPPLDGGEESAHVYV
jgi:hypothetical protein